MSHRVAPAEAVTPAASASADGGARGCGACCGGEKVELVADAADCVSIAICGSVACLGVGCRDKVPPRFSESYHHSLTQTIPNDDASVVVGFSGPNDTQRRRQRRRWGIVYF